MRYYKLFISDSDGLICNQHDLYGFDSDRLCEGRPIEEWDERITLWYEHGAVEDYLANGRRTERVLCG